MKNEKMENEEMENEEIENQDNAMVIYNNINDMRNQGSKKFIFTNITDKKQFFKVENNIDKKINDCKGEKIRVTKVLLKKFIKENEEIDEETGEIKNNNEVKLITILIDDNNISYVTASKLFGMQMLNYIELFGIQEFDTGVVIKIIEKDVKNSQHKSLGFEIV